MSRTILALAAAASMAILTCASANAAETLSLSADASGSKGRPASGSLTTSDITPGGLYNVTAIKTAGSILNPFTGYGVATGSASAGFQDAYHGFLDTFSSYAVAPGIFSNFKNPLVSADANASYTIDLTHESRITLHDVITGDITNQSTYSYLAGPGDFSFSISVGSGSPQYSQSLLGNSGFINQKETFAISAVPEPSTWAMMILGIGGIGLAFRQAKRNHGFRVKDAFAA